MHSLRGTELLSVNNPTPRASLLKRGSRTSRSGMPAFARRVKRGVQVSPKWGRWLPDTSLASILEAVVPVDC